jgi:T5orf172 domain
MHRLPPLEVAGDPPVYAPPVRCIFHPQAHQWWPAGSQAILLSIKALKPGISLTVSSPFTIHRDHQRSQQHPLSIFHYRPYPVELGLQSLYIPKEASSCSPFAPSRRGTEAMENISCMKMPGAFPEENSEIDASAPSAPRRTKSRLRDRQEPSTSPRGVPSQRYISPKAPVQSLEPESPESFCSEDNHSLWESSECNDGNTSSACITPSASRHRLTTSREGSPSTTARRSNSCTVLSRARSSPDASTNSSKAITSTSVRKTIESPYYESHPNKRAIHEVFNTTMGPLDLLDGTIYVYRTRKNPGLLKIGYTTREPRARLQEWMTRCKHVPTLMYLYPENAGQQPFARRVESLIGADLKDRRKLLPACHSCDRRHGEWYKIELTQLIPVIQKWSKIIQELKDVGALTSRPPPQPRPPRLPRSKRRKGISKKGKMHPIRKITDYFPRISAPFRKHTLWRKKTKRHSPEKTAAVATPSPGPSENPIFPTATPTPANKSLVLPHLYQLTKLLVVYIGISFVLSFYPHKATPANESLVLPHLYQLTKLLIVYIGISFVLSFQPIKIVRL